jgi:hypothetical protein
VSVDSRHMGAECARVATVNRPRLVLCLQLKGHDLNDERHRQGVLTLLTSLDGPTHKGFRTSFEHLKADVRQQPTSPRRLTVATRRQAPRRCVRNVLVPERCPSAWAFRRVSLNEKISSSAVKTRGGFPVPLLPIALLPFWNFKAGARAL